MTTIERYLSLQLNTTSKAINTGFILAMCYDEGGFYKYIEYLEKQRDDRYKGDIRKFEPWYGRDCIEIIQGLNWDEFIDDLHLVPKFNVQNFYTLNRFNKVSYMKEFSTSFNGEIVNVESIGDYDIIVTTDETRFNYYPNKDDHFSTYYNSLESALLSLLVGDHFNTCEVLRLDYFNRLNKI